MKLLGRFVIGWLCALTAVAFAAPERPPLTAKEIYKQTVQSVVTVYAGDKSGTGFFDGNYVCTCFHVISDTTSATVKTSDGQSYRVLGVVAMDRDKDFALLNIGYTRKPIPLGNWASTSVGDPVYVIGSPLGIEQTLSEGIISGKRKLQDEDLLQLSAGISHGSSGSPVLNSKGEIIGMVQSSYTDGQNLNFALSVKDLKMAYGVSLSIASQTRKLDNEIRSLLVDLKSIQEYKTLFAKTKSTIGDLNLITMDYYAFVNDSTKNIYRYDYCMAQLAFDEGPKACDQILANPPKALSSLASLFERGKELEAYLKDLITSSSVSRPGATISESRLKGLEAELNTIREMNGTLSSEISLIVGSG